MGVGFVIRFDFKNLTNDSGTFMSYTMSKQTEHIRSWNETYSEVFYWRWDVFALDDYMVFLS